MKTVNSLQLVDNTLRRNICGICQENAICMVLKYKRSNKKGERFKKMYVCTRCIPLRQELNFDNDFIVVKKKDFENMREAANEFMQALERGKVLEPVKEIELQSEKGIQLESENEMEL